MLSRTKFNGTVRKGAPAGSTGGRGPDGRNKGAVDWTGVTLGEITGVEPGAWPYYWCVCPLGHRSLYNTQTMRAAKKAGRGFKCKECGK